MGRLARFSVTLRYREIDDGLSDRIIPRRFKFAHAYLIYSKIYAKIIYDPASRRVSIEPLEPARFGKAVSGNVYRGNASLSLVFFFSTSNSLF